jgi:hypothetical protein
MLKSDCVVDSGVMCVIHLQLVCQVKQWRGGVMCVTSVCARVWCVCGL